jgi:hypothetical protein
MTVDALSFVGVSRFGETRSADDTVHAMDDEGIDTALVAPMHPVDGDFAAANRALAAIVAGSAGRLARIARVDPWDRGDALAQLSEAVADGARGVFLHPTEEHFRINDPLLRPVAAQAAELGVPVVVATGFPWFSETTQVAGFARWCGDNAVVMTNGGQLNISGMGQFDTNLALRASNVYLLSSGMYRNDFLERTVRDFGARRLLFASSAPRLNVRYEHLRVHQIGMTEQDRSLVLAGNAKRLFNID